MALVYKLTKKKAPKPCKYCGKIGHWPYQCTLNPGKPRSYFKGRGKGEALWSKTKRLWFKAHPQDRYECFYCKRSMWPYETTLDHYHPRGSHPDLKYDLENLVPCCWECNGKKGSIDGDVYRKDLPDLQQENKEGL